MLKNGYYSKGHSDRIPRVSKIFTKGKKAKIKNYRRQGLGKGKVYTEESIWIKLLKVIEILVGFGVIGYLSHMVLTSL